MPASAGREQRALRLIGAAFFALPVYLLVHATYSLITWSRPDTSDLGIGRLGLTAAGGTLSPHQSAPAPHPPHAKWSSAPYDSRPPIGSGWRGDSAATAKFPSEPGYR